MTAEQAFECLDLNGDGKVGWWCVWAEHFTVEEEEEEEGCSACAAGAVSVLGIEMSWRTGMSVI